jgi:hypothetical protein
MILGAALLAMAGCTGTSKPSTFYLLKTLPEPEAGAPVQGGVSVAVGPISLPAYLDRLPMAAAGDGHVLSVDEFHRWAEPLKDGISRVLAENLAILLKTANVYVYPHRRGVTVDCQVEIAVSRFSAEADGTAVLVAYWSIVGGDGQTVLSRNRSSLVERAASREPGAVVAAQNKVLQDLSQEIAAEIRKLQQKK